MSKRLPLLIVLLVLVAFAGLAAWRILSERTVPGRLELAGDVRSDVRTVRAPAIAHPAPDYTVGIPVERGTTPAAAGPSAASSAQRSQAAAAARMPRVSGMLARVLVAEGDRVTTGQALAVLDTAMLDLGVRQAETAAAKAHADVEVLRGTLDTLSGNQADLADAKRKLKTAHAELLKARADLVAQIATLEKMMSAPKPPSLPPGGGAVPNPVVLLPKLKAALAKIDAGLAKMGSTRAKLNSGASRLADAKAQVTDAREVLSVMAGARDIAVELAKARREQATVRSPVSGVVTEARRAGTVVMANAPIVRVRPDAPTQVDTFLTAEQLAGVVLGTPAEVDFDSNPGAPLSGRVTRIGEKAEFPPTSFPTGIVHMTRAVRVTVTLDDGGWAPPGTPADVTVLTD